MRLIMFLFNKIWRYRSMKISIYLLEDTKITNISEENRSDVYPESLWDKVNGMNPTVQSFFTIPDLSGVSSHNVAFRPPVLILVTAPVRPAQSFAGRLFCCFLYRRKLLWCSIIWTIQRHIMNWFRFSVLALNS